MTGVAFFPCKRNLGNRGGVQVGKYRLDVYDNRLWDGEREIALSPLSTRLLEILARDPGQVVERNAIIDEIWRGDFLTGDPALHRLVSETRSAVGDDPRHPTLIQTVPRCGYRLVLTSFDAEVRRGTGPRETPLGSRRLLWVFAGILLLIIVAATAAKLLIDDLTGLRGASELRLPS